MIRMISQIGSRFKRYKNTQVKYALDPLGRKPDRKSLTGFTFFEILIAVAILGTGLVMIYKALILSLDYQNHLTNRLLAIHLVEHKIATIQRDYKFSGKIPYEEDGDVLSVEINNRPMRFEYRLEFQVYEELNEMLQVVLTLSWPERGRTFSLSRSTLVSRI